MISLNPCKKDKNMHILLIFCSDFVRTDSGKWKLKYKKAFSLNTYTHLLNYSISFLLWLFCKAQNYFKILELKDLLIRRFCLCKRLDVETHALAFATKSIASQNILSI